MKISVKIFENIFIFLFGAIGYVCIEMLWRGSSHWTMLIAGGTCFCIIYHIARIRNLNLVKKAIMCMFCITTVEFLIGIVINMKLEMNVWDYSYQPANLMGQICPVYCVLWLFLSLPMIKFSSFVRNKIFVPNYKK